jgi:hypothetical protein
MSAGNCPRALLDESGMIRNQKGKHNISKYGGGARVTLSAHPRRKKATYIYINTHTRLC